MMVLFLSGASFAATDSLATRNVPLEGHHIADDMAEMRENVDYMWYGWIMSEVPPTKGVAYTATYYSNGKIKDQTVTGTPFTSPDPKVTYTYDSGTGTLTTEVWVINGITFTWTYTWSSGIFQSKTLN